MISILSIVIATNVLTNHEDCNLFDYISIDSDHCPHVDYLANLKVCHKANDNELCFSKGKCGVKININNCLYPDRDAHTYDIYVKHSKYRQIDYWENISMIYKDLYSWDPVSYCSDNYLIHETNINNPVFEDKKKYPLKTLSQCQNECLNTALDSKKRRCEAYGWRTNGIPHTETTLNECKYFYKCKIETSRVDSWKSIKQLGAYQSREHPWTELQRWTTDWVIAKGHFYNDKPLNPKTTTTTTTMITTLKTKKTKTKTTTTKTLTSKTKTTNTKTTTSKTTNTKTTNTKTLISKTLTSKTTTSKTKTTNTKTTNTKTTTSKTKTTNTLSTNTLSTKTKTSTTNTLSTNTLSTNTLSTKTKTSTLSTTSTKVSKKIPKLMTKISITPTTSYKKSKENSKTKKGINNVLIIFAIFGIFSIIAVAFFIIIYFRRSYRTQQDTNDPPINRIVGTYNNPIYQGENTITDTNEVPTYEPIDGNANTTAC